MARPKLGDSDTERLHLKITADEIKAIEDWRYENRVPSRSEAVRRLVQMGLIFASFTEFFGRNGKDLADYLYDVDEGTPKGETAQISRSRLHDLQIFTASAVWAASRGMKFSGPEDLRKLIETDDRLVRLLDEAGIEVEDAE